MKYKDLFPDKNSNYSKAKRISAMAKDKAKKSNPGETEDRGGWAVDPHQGTFDRMRMTR